ncbi:MAG: hypothetical protein ACTHK6_10575 [Solirubrobacterales bacterium]
MSPRSTEQIGARWTAAGALASLLVEGGRSEASLEALPKHRAELEELAEEGVLQRTGDEVRFFHDRYLDYVFARTFVEGGESLGELLRGSEQHLERRAQVRKILAFQREDDREGYERTVAELLHDEEIRFHIKEVVFALLRDEQEPGPAMWEAIRDFVEDSERSEHPAAWRVACQPAWFIFLEARGVLSSWLTSAEEVAQERAAAMLFAVVDVKPQMVASLLSPFVDAGENWGRRIRRILEFGRLEQDRALFELALSLLERGHYDEEPESLWLAAHDLPSTEPGWAADLLEATFARACGRGEKNPFAAELFPSNRGIDEFLRDLAANAPGPALAVLVPVIIATSRDCAREEDRDGLRPDSVWWLRHVGSDHDFAQSALTITERAAKELAEEHPEEWQPHANALLAEIDLETPRRLLYQAWSANPAVFANAAIETVAAGPDRLRSGYADSPYWATRELLERATPRCSQDLFERVEQTIIGYLPAWERKPDSEDFRGQSEWTLLSGLDRRRLSEAGSERFAELNSRFGLDVEQLRPRGVRAGFVGSPLPDVDVSKFTDEEWLAALGRFDRDETNWVDEVPVGGAPQVARQLEAAVKLDPDRFARLGLQFSDGVNAAYFEAVITGLANAESDPNPDLVQEFLRRCHRLPGHPCGRWFGVPLRKLADAEIAADVLEMVAWYAREDPDPQKDSWRAEEGETEYWGGDILTAGINSVRGSTAETISALIFNRPERLETLGESIKHLVEDPVLSVRACAAETLSTLTRHDPELATSLFLRLVETEDVLLGAPTIERFLSYRGVEDWGRLHTVIERMVAAEEDSVGQAGARRAAICALRLDKALPLAELAAAGTVAQRKGVAQIAAANLTVEDSRDLCERWLTTLFSDSESEVRAEAGRWTDQIEADDLEHLVDIAISYMDSPAYLDDPSMLLYRLEETTAAVPELMLYAAQRFAKGSGREAADIRRSAAADAPHASNLAMRAYSSTDDPELRSNALDVIDQLLASGVRDMQSHIDAYEDR